MTTFRRYLCHRLEIATLRTVVMTVAAVLITHLCVADSIVYSNSQYSQTGLYVLATILGVICTVIPMLELFDLKKRRNMDTFFFLPIGRVKLGLAHWISGWLQVWFIYSVAYLWSFVYLHIQTDYFDLSHMLPYYFISLLIGLIMYSSFMFLFGEGNTALDGFFFCVLGMFVFGALFEIVNESIHVFERRNECKLPFSIESEWGIVYALINNLTVIFQKLIHINQVSRPTTYYQEYTAHFADYLVFWLIIGILSVIGYLWRFRRMRAEQVEDISNSWFGYRTMIPIYGYGLLFFNGMDDLIGVYILLAMVAAYILYRRSFKIKKSDILVLALGSIPILANAAFL